MAKDTQGQQPQSQPAPAKAQDAVNPLGQQLDQIQATLDRLPSQLQGRTGLGAVSADISALFEAYDKTSDPKEVKALEDTLSSIGMGTRRVNRMAMNPVSALEDWALNGQGWVRGTLKATDAVLTRVGAGKGIWDIGKYIVGLF